MPTEDTEVRYVAVLKVTRVTTTIKRAGNYLGADSVSDKKTESHQVPAVRAADLDRLRQKLGQYMDLVTDEDFGDEPKVMRGRDSD